MFQLEGRKRFQGNPLEKPQEKPADTWAARKEEFLQKVTIFYIPSLCLQPARASMKDPYSSPPGTTQTASAVVEGGPGAAGGWGRGGAGQKAARCPDFPFPGGILMFARDYSLGLPASAGCLRRWAVSPGKAGRSHRTRSPNARPASSLERGGDWLQGLDTTVPRHRRSSLQCPDACLPCPTPSSSGSWPLPGCLVNGDPPAHLLALCCLIPFGTQRSV